MGFLQLFAGIDTSCCPHCEIQISTGTSLYVALACPDTATSKQIKGLDIWKPLDYNVSKALINHRYFDGLYQPFGVKLERDGLLLLYQHQRNYHLEHVFIFLVTPINAWPTFSHSPTESPPSKRNPSLTTWCLYQTARHCGCLRNHLAPWMIETL